MSQSKLLVKSKEELLILFNHMIKHNFNHIEELKELLDYVKLYFDNNIVESLDEIINDFDNANKNLNNVYLEISK